MNLSLSATPTIRHIQQIGAIGGAFAGIGVTLGVPIGAAGGAIFGLVASASTSSDHTVSFKIGPDGIVIVITPVNRFS